MKQKYVSLRYKILINHSLVTKIRCAALATKIWRLCRSLVNARGASYSLVFRDTEDVIQQPQQHLLSTTYCALRRGCDWRQWRQLALESTMLYEPTMLSKPFCGIAYGLFPWTYAKRISHRVGFWQFACNASKLLHLPKAYASKTNTMYSA